MKAALETAREKARELVADGTEAVVLVGSHARGGASPESDLDLIAVGGDSYLPRLEVRDGLLVSVSMQSVSVIRREDLGLPKMVCAAVPGWREAVILEDPNGAAASLIEEARSWEWEPVEEACDEWVAEEITGNAEEVHKLVAALGGGNLLSAAVQRNLLATHLAPILAVHRRILYGSENGMLNLVAEAMGEEWRTAQSTAHGINGEPFERTCRAALELYLLAADEVCGLLAERQRRVVEKAVAIVEGGAAQSASL